MAVLVAWGWRRLHFQASAGFVPLSDVFLLQCVSNMSTVIILSRNVVSSLILCLLNALRVQGPVPGVCGATFVMLDDELGCGASMLTLSSG